LRPCRPERRRSADGQALCPSKFSIASQMTGAALCLMAVSAWADSGSAGSDQVPERPAILFNRWQENWGVLAVPRVRREPLDDLKYIPLSAADANTYLSFGADARERFESNNAAGFGTGPNHTANYLISRTELHADFLGVTAADLHTNSKRLRPREDFADAGRSGQVGPRTGICHANRAL
jgi:hypothetical protein